MINFIKKAFHYMVDRLPSEERMVTRTMSFEKDKGIWYAVIPEWQGGRAALAMVAGADTLLDYFADGKNLVTIMVSNDPEVGKAWSLRKSTYVSTAIDNSGNYSVPLHDISDRYVHEFWLCGVARFVFGDYPKHIYFNVI